jgi:putative ABC transport system permease protein
MVMLPMIANHAPIAINDMTPGVLMVMLIALIMIAWQTLKIARANPAEVLKAE